MTNLKLPDEVLVYPAHGAGSLCGRSLRAERSSTIGTERFANYALQIKNREEFIQQLTSGFRLVLNIFCRTPRSIAEASALADLPELKAISPRN